MGKRKKKKHLKKESVRVKAATSVRILTWKAVYTSPWFIPLVVTFAFIILLSIRLIIDIDLGFHLRGGEWMLQHKAFHRYDVFTYTVNNNEYIAMYWFYQIMLYFVYTLLSYGGLTIFNALLITLVFFIMFLRMKIQGAPLFSMVLVLFFSVLAMELRLGVRPEVMTWLFLALMLLVLDQYFYHRKNYLFWLPLIQLLWVNTHGLFILGWVVTGAYLVSTSVDRRTFDKVLFRWFLATIIISCVNPYFLKGIAFPFYLFTRLQSTSIFKDVISEFVSPWSQMAVEKISHLPLYVYYAFSILGLVSLGVSFRRRKIHEFILFPAFFYLSYAIIRNVPLFVIIASNVLVGSARDVQIPASIKDHSNKIFHRFASWLPVAATIFLLLCCLRLISNAFYVDRGGGNFGLGLDQQFHPVKAARFLVENDLDGRILNDMNLGSWLIWKVPQPVYIDGRLEVMQEEFFREYHRSHAPGGLTKLISKYKPRLILFDYGYPQALQWDIQLKEMPGWRIIYWDETAVIYAPETYALHFPALSFTATVAALGIDTTLSDSTALKILRAPVKTGFLRWLEGFFIRQHLRGDLTKMAFYAYLNLEFRAAELLYLEALRMAPDHREEIFSNLGAVYYFSQNYERSFYCYQRVFQQNSQHTLARRRMLELKQLLAQ